MEMETATGLLSEICEKFGDQEWTSQEIKKTL